MNNTLTEGQFLAARRIRGEQGGTRWLNVLAAGSALGGIGVWSMHFTGMLALRLGMGSGYAMAETLVSLVAAVAATSAALAFVAQRPDSNVRVLGAGALLGLGVAFMHYLGMAGMRFPRLAAALVMGVAVCAMHYTGMAAADFICTAPATERFATPRGFAVISSMGLAVLTPLVAIALAVLIAFDQMIQKNLRQPHARRA